MGGGNDAPPTTLTAAQEKEAVEAVWKDALGVDEVWCLCDARWWRLWCEYSGFKRSAPDAEAERPPQIDLTDITSPENPLELRQGLEENVHFVLMHEAVWKLLKGWYTVKDNAEFPREVFTIGIRKETRIDMHPVFLNIVLIGDDGEPDESTKVLKSFQRRTTFEEILAQFQKPKEKKVETKADDPDEFPDDVSAAPESVTETMRVWLQEKEKEKEAGEPTQPTVKAGRSSSDPGDGTPLLLTNGDEPANDDAVKSVKTTDDVGTETAVDADLLLKGQETAEETAPKIAASTSETFSDNMAGEIDEDLGGNTTVDVEAAVEVKPKGPQWKAIAKSDLGQPVDVFHLPSGTVIWIEEKTAEGDWKRTTVKKNYRDFVVGDKVDAMDSVKKWYESTVRAVKPDPEDPTKGSVLIHFDGWADRWDEWMPFDSDRIARQNTHTTGPYQVGGGGSYDGGWLSYRSSTKGKPPAPGAVGLVNLGNTCFMNSTLQCMSNTPLITDFFVDDVYVDDINRDNPLGWKGRIADEYGALLKDMWGGEYTTVAPIKFKQAVGEFQPRFSGYQQQDSSELLSFLLDGLHEDLNRVKKKPATGAVESDGRPDKEVANEAWEVYLKRNQSIVVDLFQGQLKSKLTCPKCKRISITFDPFMFLSVPLPTVADTTQTVSFVPADPSKPILKVDVLVSKVALIMHLKESLAKIVGVSSKALVVVEEFHKKIHKVFREDEDVSGIHSNDVVYVFERTELEQHPKPREIRWGQVNHWNKDGHDNHGIPVPAMFNSNKPTVKEIREETHRAIQRFLPEDAKGSEERPYRLTYTHWNRCLNVPDNDEEEIDLGEHGRVYVNVLWDDEAYNTENGEKVEEFKGSDDAQVSEQDDAEKEQKPLSVQDCISSFTRAEVLSEEDPWYCNKCKEFQCATKKFDLWKLPDILIIHLKRFAYSHMNRNKIMSFVDFPIKELDMAPFCVNEDEMAHCMYDLHGVSRHMGGLGGGHYNAFCKNLSNGQWYCHDDSSVRPIDEDKLKDEEAYVLFYHRRDPLYTKSNAAAAAKKTHVHRT